MNKKEIKCNVLVIGGGPAGMMAAIAASQKGANVFLVEKKSELGIKLLMTGKGRCNLTNAETDIGKFVSVFGRNGKFLYSAFNFFGPKETINFFEERGVKLKTERGKRMFPESDRSGEIRDVLVSEMKKNKVSVFKNCKIHDIILKNDKIISVETDGSYKLSISANKIIIATGGLSYPMSGSSGDGYVWAKKFGHRIIDTIPALSPVIVKEDWIRELEGLSLKNVRIDIFQGGKKKDERFGEAIFTSDGMSGPIILDASKKIGDLLRGGSVEIIIDFKPALDFNELDKRIQRDFEENINKKFINSLDGLLPKKLIPVIVKFSNISSDKKVNMISREERIRLVHLLKEFKLEVSNILGFEKAIITSGGIDLREIDPRTMKSKIISNLYFAGEVINLDAPTGGYNLQECWSTGYLAGDNAA